MNFSSKLLEDAVGQFAKLPGIGSKTALRLVLHLLKQDISEVTNFTSSLEKLKNELQFCEECGNLSDSSICSVCANTSRDKTIICVVEDTRDVMAVENTHQYRGVYHVLGGLISPMNGVSPSDLTINQLVARASNGNCKEIILALSATMEGDTTLFYLYKKLKDSGIIISTIARGIAFGGEIEYADEITLGRSIAARIPYEQMQNK